MWGPQWGQQAESQGPGGARRGHAEGVPPGSLLPASEGCLGRGWGAPTVSTSHWGGGQAWRHQNGGCSGGHRGGVPRDPGRGGPVRMSHGEDPSWGPEAVGGGLGAEGHSLERVHAKGHVHARAVGQEGSQGRLLKQPEDQDLVPGGTGRAVPRPPQPTHRHRSAPRGRRTGRCRGTWTDRQNKTDPGRWRQRTIKTERQRQGQTHRQAVMRTQ